MSNQAFEGVSAHLTDCLFLSPEASRAGSPSLIYAFQSVRDVPEPTRWYKQNFWVLDYAYTDLGVYKVGDGKSPELPRRAFSAHLYLPGTSFWENMGAGPMPNRSAGLIFANGASIGLDALLDARGFAVFDDPSGILAQLLDRLIDIAGQRGNEGFCAAQSLFYQVLDTLMTAKRLDAGRYVTGDDGSRRPSSLVERVKNYLEKHLSEKISLIDIAVQANISLSTLTHQYKKEMGEAPMRTLTRTRLERATFLLLRGDALKNVAMATGFADEFHFSKVFKTFMGVSPRDYRKRFAKLTDVGH